MYLSGQGHLIHNNQQKMLPLVLRCLSSNLTESRRPFCRALKWATVTKNNLISAAKDVTMMLFATFFLSGMSWPIEVVDLPVWDEIRGAHLVVDAVGQHCKQITHHTRININQHQLRTERAGGDACTYAWRGSGRRPRGRLLRWRSRYSGTPFWSPPPSLRRCLLAPQQRTIGERGRRLDDVGERRGKRDLGSRARRVVGNADTKWRETFRGQRWVEDRRTLARPVWAFWAWTKLGFIWTKGSPNFRQSV